MGCSRLCGSSFYGGWKIISWSSGQDVRALGPPPSLCPLLPSQLPRPCPPYIPTLAVMNTAAAFLLPQGTWLVWVIWSRACVSRAEAGVQVLEWGERHPGRWLVPAVPLWVFQKGPDSRHNTALSSRLTLENCAIKNKKSETADRNLTVARLDPPGRVSS